MKNIILASTSPRRKQLLEKLGLDFVIVPSNVDETLNPRLKPRRQAEVLSLQKAEAVAQQYKGKNAVIIAADSLVAVENDILGKPQDKKDAKRMLRQLSGKEHSVFTGMTVIDTERNKIITKATETKVTFKKLSPQEINAYLATKEPYDKAGAYALQGLAAIFIRRIEGDFFGAVGLSLFQLREVLKKCDIVLLS